MGERAANGMRMGDFFGEGVVPYGRGEGGLPNRELGTYLWVSYVKRFSQLFQASVRPV